MPARETRACASRIIPRHAAVSCSRQDKATACVTSLLGISRRRRPMTAATSHFLLYIVEEILPREPLGSPTAVRHLSARDAPPSRNTCQPTASMSPRGRVASAARWARISGEMDGAARSLVPAVADAANGMIYEEEGRPESTSKGRPTRAGHIFRTRVFNTVHSVPIRCHCFSRFCSNATYRQYVSGNFSH